MVDRYYRKIEDVENDIENAMQISSILLKLKGYDDDLSKIDDNSNNISTNLGKINTNTDNISTNLGKINTNTDNISTNLGKISANTDNISTNLGKISTNTDNISTNLGKISANTDNISTNLGKINTNTDNISTNLGKLNTNTDNISSNLGKINTNKSDIDEINSNLSNIDFNSGNKYSIENFFIYNIKIENSYKLNKDKRNFSIFKYTLEDDFKKDSILEVDCRLLYRYNNYNHIGLLQHIFKLYDDNDNMFYDYKSLKTNAGDNTRNDIRQNDFFYVKLNDDYKIIKIELILSLINDISNTTIVDCKLYNTYKSNFLSIKYYKKINLISVNNNLGDLENTILSNKNNISINLGKINNILSSNLINGNVLKKVFVYDIEFYKKLIFSYTEKSYLIFSREIEFNFKAYNYIEIYSEILFDYLNHYEIGLLKTEYIFYDDRNIQIEKFEKYQNNSGSSSNNYLITKDYMLFINKSNNTKLKLDIYVSLIKDIEDRHTDFTVNFINNYKNKIYIKYYEK